MHRIGLFFACLLASAMARGQAGPHEFTRASYAELIRPQWRFNGGNGLGEDGTASGFFCAYGLRAGLCWDPQTGRGLAYFTSAVATDTPLGHSAFSAAEESIVERAVRAPFRKRP